LLLRGWWAAILAATGRVTIIVYRWINLDRLWITALIATGLALLLV
jgi:hypothetical protein